VSIKIFGTKIGMTQIFDEDGSAIPVTILRVGPCIVTQIKTVEKDGYSAIQIGYLQTKLKKLSKPQLGHVKKAGAPPLFHLGEHKIDNISDYTVGQSITTEAFKIGQLVNITGKSIGKGFSGNQKRHNFKRGPMSHGSKNHRAPGSIGPGTTPGRVFPGKKMPGQYGAKQVTISKLKVLGIDSEQNILIVKGSVPGKPGNLITVQTKV
jgi:large subunit ribosomal protein L3